MKERLNESEPGPKSSLALLEERAVGVVPGYEPGATLEYSASDDEEFTCRVEPAVRMGGGVATVVRKISPAGHEIGMAMPGNSSHWTVDAGVGKVDAVDGEAEAWVEEQLRKLRGFLDRPDASEHFHVIPPEEQQAD